MSINVLIAMFTNLIPTSNSYLAQKFILPTSKMEMNNWLPNTYAVYIARMVSFYDQILQFIRKSRQ